MLKCCKSGCINCLEKIPYEGGGMKVFITKFALTKGIIEANGEISENFPDMLGVTGQYSHFNKSEWFIDRADAVANAEQRRLKKIASLEKQITKLKKLKFAEEE